MTAGTPSDLTRPTGRGWAYACAQLGAVASVAANVAHSFVQPVGATVGWTPPVGAVIASVFWPAALVFAIEAFARVAWPAGWRYGLLRFGGLLPVALVAAVVSYLHLSGLLASYAAGRFEVHVGPLAVDGLMVIGTAALIATSRPRQRRMDATRATDVTPPGPAASPTPETSAATEAVTPDVTPDTATATPPKLPPSAVKIARLHARSPELTNAQMAKRLQMSERTVIRWRPARDTATTPDTATVNGRTPALTRSERN